MAKRMIETEMKLTGMEEYVAGIDRITSALERTIAAKKEFNVLLENTPNAQEEGQYQIGIGYADAIPVVADVSFSVLYTMWDKIERSDEWHSFLKVLGRFQ